MSLKERVAAKWKYGRFIFDAKANFGRCLTCDHRTPFIETGRETLVRVVPSDTRIEYLLPADYHGGPEDPERSLVIREWGDDFVDFVSEHDGLSTEIVEMKDRKLGLDGNAGISIASLCLSKVTYP